jgi:hypothetical protein
VIKNTFNFKKKKKKQTGVILYLNAERDAERCREMQRDAERDVEM